ncbi:MAG: penicillin-binding protein 2 [Desulfobacterales bacterium]|nr:penicillin-binding protein 2 [Desulfobacterales bacterium]
MKPAAKIPYMRLRSTLVGVCFSLAMAGIGAKAVHLQVFRGAWLSQKAADQYEKTFTSEGRRGTIFDTNLTEIAVSIDAISIGAHPALVTDPPAAAVSLARTLKLNRKDLLNKLKSKNTFVWIKRHVSPKETEAIKAFALEGITFLPEYSRFYPNRTLGAQLLGFSGTDGHGLEGIEFAYDRKLKGAEEKFTVLTDALGRGIAPESKPSTNFSGNNLVLTIDRNIQFITESALAEAVDKFSAASGMAMVMSPKTGAVWALANYPPFNPNAFRDFKRETWRNRIITDPYEPGSTLKIFSAAAALESGECTANTIFFCENGAYRVGRNLVHDTHPYGWLSLQQIVKYSSNIGAVKIGEQIGPEKLHHTLRAFGFGEKTGIDCPGETAGSLPPLARWTRIDAGAISFGQGVAVSTVQLLAAACAIANDGILMRPYIVQAVTDQNGRLIERTEPHAVRRVISVQTAQTLRRIMKTVVEEGGTGVNAALEGYSVCGKTGTAQKIDERGTYARGKYVSSFLGFAPAENPEIAVLVVVDEPQKYHYGGTVAAPAFKKIAHETLSYRNIPSKGERDRLTVSLESEING